MGFSSLTQGVLEAASPVVARDTVVWLWESSVMNLKGREVTNMVTAFFQRKYRAFDVWFVFECGCDMMEERYIVYDV